MRCLFAAAVFALFQAFGLLTGCSGSPDGPQAGGQFGSESSSGCLAVSTTMLPMAEASVLGFSGADLMALVGGDHAATLAWAKGGSTEATVSVNTQATEARYLDREWTDDGSGIELAMDCPDVLEVDVIVGFTTADGAFRESWTSKIMAPTAAQASFFQELDLAALGGSYQVTEVNPAEFDEVRAFLDADFDAEGVHGRIDGQAIENGDPSLPDSTASARLFGIATF
jgi:hypothetical protein